MMEKNIKDYREKELRAYVIGNMLIVMLGNGMLNTVITPSEGIVPWTEVNNLLGSTIFSAVIYIYVFIADSLVPGKWKDKFIWFFSGIPGETIFTEIREKDKDIRIMSWDAEKKYATIYATIDAEPDQKKVRKIQNAEWYKIYRTHEEKPQVFVAQRDFLLCRDMNILTIFIIVGCFLFQLYIGEMSHFGVLGILILEFLITLYAAKCKGSRFAYNVIATDIAESATKS